MRGQFITRATIKDRGWTDAMIDKYLHSADKEVPNPHYKKAAPMRLYDLSRVKRAEKKKGVQSALLAAASRRSKGLDRAAIAAAAEVALNIILKGWGGDSGNSVGVALDLVQDETGGNRRDAVLAIAVAAVKAKYDDIPGYEWVFDCLARSHSGNEEERNASPGVFFAGKREVPLVLTLWRSLSTGEAAGSVLRCLACVLLGKLPHAVGAAQLAHAAAPSHYTTWLVAVIESLQKAYLDRRIAKYMAETGRATFP